MEHRDGTRSCYRELICYWKQFKLFAEAEERGVLQKGYFAAALDKAEEDHKLDLLLARSNTDTFCKQCEHCEVQNSENSEHSKQANESAVEQAKSQCNSHTGSEEAEDIVLSQHSSQSTQDLSEESCSNDDKGRSLQKQQNRSFSCWNAKPHNVLS
jgi:hypothetical protein